jgi:hypothetical protein
MKTQRCLLCQAEFEARYPGYCSSKCRKEAEKRSQTMGGRRSSCVNGGKAGVWESKA